MEQLKRFHACFTSCALIICSKNNIYRWGESFLHHRKFFYPKNGNGVNWKEVLENFSVSGITPSLTFANTRMTSLSLEQKIVLSWNRASVARTIDERLPPNLLLNRKFSRGWTGNENQIPARGIHQLEFRFGSIVQMTNPRRRYLNRRILNANIADIHC